MKIKLGVIMDPINTIHPEKDTTLAILLEAQSRQWPIYYMEQRDIFMRDGKVHARMRLLKVRDDQQNWFTFDKEIIQPLDALNVILMRKDPPVDQEYIYTTLLLDLVESLGTFVVNKPQSLRDVNEKLFTSHFPQCCPPTLVTHQAKQIKDFLKEQGDIILKPLDAMGGKSIFRLTKNDPNINVIIETLTQYETNYISVQKYIPEISEGDKRIILIDGEPITYALARMAAPGETRANLAAGGKGVGVPLSDHDKWICQQVGPTLRDRGFLLVGLDVIGNYLTEINVTSPTCVRELDKLYGLNISAKLLDVITKKCK